MPVARVSAQVLEDVRERTARRAGPSGRPGPRRLEPLGEGRGHSMSKTARDITEAATPHLSKQRLRDSGRCRGRSARVTPRVVVPEDAGRSVAPAWAMPEAPTWQSPTPWPQPLPVKTKRRDVARGVQLAVDHEQVLAQAQPPADLAGPCSTSSPSLPSTAQLDHAARDAQAPRHHVAHACPTLAVARDRAARPRRASGAPPSGSSARRGRPTAPSRLCSASRNTTVPSCTHEAAPCRPPASSAPRRPGASPSSARNRRASGSSGIGRLASSSSSTDDRSASQRRGTRRRRPGGRAAPCQRPRASSDHGLRARDGRRRAQRVVRERREDALLDEQRGRRRARRRSRQLGAVLDLEQVLRVLGREQALRALVPAERAAPGGGRRRRGASRPHVRRSAAALAVQRGQQPRCVQRAAAPRRVAGPLQRGRRVRTAAPALRARSGSAASRFSPVSPPRTRAASSRLRMDVQAARSGRQATPRR